MVDWKREKTIVGKGLLTRIYIQLRESVAQACEDYSVLDIRLAYAKGMCVLALHCPCAHRHPLTLVQGKRRAFIQFEDVDHATAFVDDHFPKVLITLPHATDEVPDGKCSAFIHFAHPKADGDTRAGGQWVCQPVRNIPSSRLDGGDDN